jgi:hypothetical protein
MKCLEADRYISAIYTNVTWIKDILKAGLMGLYISIVTNINSLLKSVATENISRFAPTSSHQAPLVICAARSDARVVMAHPEVVDNKEDWDLVVMP